MKNKLSIVLIILLGLNFLTLLGYKTIQKGYLLLNRFNYLNKVQDDKTTAKGNSNFSYLSQVLSDVSGTPCTPPTEGCGTNYYWDSAACSCIFSCNPPTGGCGINYYWDSAACMCVTQSCTPPTSGCPVNYYWDTASCSCKITTTCTPPTGGCESNYYWDTNSCMCKPNSNCIPPSNGCGTNYYWDTTTCSCQSSTTCIPPTAGCGTNYYWDSASCICKASTTNCTPPSYGCGSNYYWDSYSCSCKLNTTCYPPSSGCANNFYWDYYTCSCRPYNQTQIFDRLAYEPQERINCVRSILSSGDFEKFRYILPLTSAEQDEIINLGNRTKSCWNSYLSPIGSPSATIVGSIASPIEKESCLIKALGNTVYQEINQGKRKPTYEDHLQFEKCYGNLQPDSINYLTNSKSIPKEIDNCLKSVLENTYEKVKLGQTDVPYELRDKVERCFGIDPQPFEEGKTFKLPDELKDCLLKSIGEARFNQINSGSMPTDEEKKKGESCFSKLNKIQVKFLPPPPEQVPFLQIKPDVIKLAEVTQETKIFEERSTGGKVTMSGKGPANSVVTIYIYSEPIVVTTKTDDNGDWIYELDQPLSGQKHIAYAITKDENGENVRSAVYNFEVIAAEESRQVLLEEGKAQPFASKYLKYAIIFITAAFIFVIFATYKILAFKKATNNLDGGNGEGEGKTGTGSVN